MDARTDIAAAVRAARGPLSRRQWLDEMGLDWHPQALYRLEYGAIDPARVAQLAAAEVLSPELSLLGLAYALRVPLETARSIAASPVPPCLPVDPQLLAAWCARCLAA